MKFSQIKENCLYVQNLDVSEKFYTKVLGFEMIAKEENRHVFFRVGKSVLLCFVAEVTKNDQVLPPHAGYGTSHLAFEINAHDYEQTKMEIKEKQIDIIHEHSWREGISSFYFRDPDGHLLEVVPAGMWEKLNA